MLSEYPSAVYIVMASRVGDAISPELTDYCCSMNLEYPGHFVDISPTTFGQAAELRDLGSVLTARICDR